MTNPTVKSEVSDCKVIKNLAQRDKGIASVGEKAEAFVIETYI